MCGFNIQYSSRVRDVNISHGHSLSQTKAPGQKTVNPSTVFFGTLLPTNRVYHINLTGKLYGAYIKLTCCLISILFNPGVNTWCSDSHAQFPSEVTYQGTEAYRPSCCSVNGALIW